MVRINSNMPGLMAWLQSGETQKKDSLSMERLAKDLKVRAEDNRGKTDTSEKMRDQIRGHNRAISDLQQEVSLLQTAAEGLGEIQSELQNISELMHPEAAQEAAADEPSGIKAAVYGHIEKIDEISANTRFGEQQLLDGSPQNAGHPLLAALGPMDSAALELAAINVEEQNLQDKSLEQINAAMEKVVTERERMLEKIDILKEKLGSLLTASENLSASESLIREADTAMESLNAARDQIRADAGQALQAQGNLEQLRTSHLLS